MRKKLTSQETGGTPKNYWEHCLLQCCYVIGAPTIYCFTESKKQKVSVSTSKLNTFANFLETNFSGFFLSFILLFFFFFLSFLLLRKKIFSWGHFLKYIFFHLFVAFFYFCVPLLLFIFLFFFIFLHCFFFIWEQLIFFYSFFSWLYFAWFVC